jgi:hypothetical protein
MILTRPEIRAILRGRKTECRRPMHVGAMWRGRRGEIVPLRDSQHGEALGRAHIVSVGRQHLTDLTAADARAEGYRTVEQFRCGWVRTHDGDWMRRRESVVVDELRPDELLDRFRERHEHLAVWVIGLRFCGEPRFLVPAVGRGKDTDDYTSASDPLGAGECVDAVTLDAMAERNRRRFESRRARIRQDAAAERFERARLQAVAQGVDVSSQVRAVERMAAALERRAQDVA